MTVALGFVAVAGIDTPAQSHARVLATASASSSRALPAGALRIHKVQIMDPVGFGRPMVAATALVPPDWRTQGGVQWAQNIACTEPATFAWTAVAPDGITSIELFPTQVWAAGSNGPGDCMPGDYATVRAYLEAYVQRRWPGARPLDFRARSDFLEASKAYLEKSFELMRSAGINGWADAGELLYAHQQAGVEIRGVVAASAVFYKSELANPMGGPPLAMLTGATTGTFAARAPAGRLDLRQAEMMRRAITPDPAWLQELFKFQEKLRGIQTQGVADRAAIVVAGGAAMTKATVEANQMATQNHASRDATSDRMQRESIEAVRGVETYNEPVEGGTITLDATYDHAWRMRDGSYVLTNDPSFNPNLALGMEGQELQRTQ